MPKLRLTDPFCFLSHFFQHYKPSYPSSSMMTTMIRYLDGIENEKQESIGQQVSINRTISLSSSSWNFAFILLIIGSIFRSLGDFHPHHQNHLHHLNEQPESAISSAAVYNYNLALSIWETQQLCTMQRLFGASVLIVAPQAANIAIGVALVSILTIRALRT